MKKSLLARWRANFFTGLIVILPGLISFGVLFWLFGSVTNVTDKLLFFLRYSLDPKYIYQNGTTGPMFWYWSWLAMILAVILICLVGLAARNYFGKKLIEWLDTALMHIPLLIARRPADDGSRSSRKVVIVAPAGGRAAREPGGHRSARG